MGIKTVAIYSDADFKSKHVKLADEAVPIGGLSAKDSYLNVEKILEAIELSGAEALHPGYGFLSENAAFVKTLDKNGVVFVGPSAQSIAAMGDKLESKRLAIRAGVNTVPGYDGIIQDQKECMRISNDIGYPVMIKASAGGGGMGMRIARNDHDAKKGFEMASEEAQNSFGDRRILLEKYIENPRHIEIQILADKFGNAVHLNERECSIQRRNQKVIEEAPSTFLDEKTRELMGSQAISLCKQIGYYSAGTVEFLVDVNKSFYFLEMNTRLQVEHCITECITGIDIVEEMIHVSANNPLRYNQNEICINGWAIETRIYAEDPYKNYVPSVGRIHKYLEPENVRCDSGIEEGSEVSIYYDPLISKLITHAPTRIEAIEQNINALDDYIIRGVEENIPLLRDILTEKYYQNGIINTNYITDIYKDGFKTKILSKEHMTDLILIAAVLYAKLELKHRKILNSTKLKRAKELKTWNLNVQVNSENKYNINILKIEENTILVDFGKNKFQIKNNFTTSNLLIKTEIDNRKVVMQILEKSLNGNFSVIYKGGNYKLYIAPQEAVELFQNVQVKARSDFSKNVRSPMPGLIKSVKCQVGDVVVKGQELCVIEAMKMQNALWSATSGKVKRINIKEGDVVADNDVLIELN